MRRQYKEACDRIEMQWSMFSHFPDHNELKITYEIEDPDDFLNNSEVIRFLTQRGINYKLSNDLTNEQMAAINTMINFQDRRTRASKLRDLGITPAKWQGWLKQKRFKQFLHQLSSTEFSDNLHVAHEGLLKAVDSGKPEAVKLYMELTGRYQSPESQNVRLILAHIIESIQRHVKDPEVIKAIAKDFEAIMAGQLQPDLAAPVDSAAGASRGLIQIDI